MFEADIEVNIHCEVEVVFEADIDCEVEALFEADIVVGSKCCSKRISRIRHQSGHQSRTR